MPELLSNSIFIVSMEWEGSGVANAISESAVALYVGMAQDVSFSLYIGIGAKFKNTQKTGETRLCTAEYRTVLL